MNIPLYKQDGTQNGEVAVSEVIFGRKVNKALVHRILLLQQSNRRHPISHTLTKGEVSGGGKKPHKQKHTGQARTGSTRNPHMKGGGVAFGPRNVRNYTLNASKKERRAALFSALSDKLNASHISAIEDVTLKTPKTKLFAEMVSKLPFKKKVLFVLPERNDATARSARNLPRVKTILVNYLNIEDVLNYTDVVFVKESIPKLEQIFCS